MNATAVSILGYIIFAFFSGFLVGGRIGIDLERELNKRRAKRKEGKP